MPPSPHHFTTYDLPTRPNVAVKPRSYKRWLLRAIGLSLITLVILFLALRHFSYKQITININGSTHNYRTRTDTVAHLLDEADIYLDESDRISPALNGKLQSGMTITISRAHQLVLDNNGEIQRLYAHTTDPLVILAENNVFLNPYDQLYVNNQLIDLNAIPKFPITPTHLKVVRAKRFSIIDDGQLIAEGYTTAITVGEILGEQQSLILYNADQIMPQPNTPLTDGLQISIKRSQPLTIHIDDREIHTRTIGTTVEDVLTRLGFGLTGRDYTIPSASTPFEPNMIIEIIRVVETIEIQQDPIVFQTIVIPDPNLPVGQRVVVQEGVAGIQESRIQIRRENSNIVSRVVQSRWIAATPVPQIMSYGTQETAADFEATPER
jgi:uncharacterized protein YabE (DUF348 family)